MRIILVNLGKERYFEILLTCYVKYKARNVKSIRYFWIQAWKILVKFSY